MHHILLMKSRRHSFPFLVVRPRWIWHFFYADTWQLVDDELITAVLDALQEGRILKELNHTVITLVPKTKCPHNVSECRPISCCNTIYKCITKVLCGRLRQVLPDLIMENQSVALFMADTSHIILWFYRI